MTEIKKFQRGHRTYTRMGAFKEVRIQSDHPGPNPTPPAPSSAAVHVDIDPHIEMGVYSNTTFVHKSSDEVVLDFSFLQPQTGRARVLSRVILSPKQARHIAKLLKQASHDHA